MEVLYPNGVIESRFYLLKSGISFCFFPGGIAFDAGQLPGGIVLSVVNVQVFRHPSRGSVQYLNQRLLQYLGIGIPADDIPQHHAAPGVNPGHQLRLDGRHLPIRQLIGDPAVKGMFIPQKDLHDLEGPGIAQGLHHPLVLPRPVTFGCKEMGAFQLPVCHQMGYVTAYTLVRWNGPAIGRTDFQQLVIQHLTLSFIPGKVFVEPDVVYLLLHFWCKGGEGVGILGFPAQAQDLVIIVVGPGLPQHLQGPPCCLQVFVHVAVQSPLAHSQLRRLPDDVLRLVCIRIVDDVLQEPGQLHRLVICLAVVLYVPVHIGIQVPGLLWGQLLHHDITSFFCIYLLHGPVGLLGFGA